MLLTPFLLLSLLDLFFKSFKNAFVLERGKLQDVSNIVIVMSFLSIAV